MAIYIYAGECSWVGSGAGMLGGSCGERSDTRRTEVGTWGAGALNTISY